MKQYGPGFSNYLWATDDGYLTQSDFNLMVVLGEDAGFSSVNKFGENTNLATAGTEYTIWDNFVTYPWPTAGTATTIESSSINDDSVGGGAQKVRVFGLDANYAAIQEDVVMDGTNAVTLDNEYLRVYRAYILDVGATATNAGTISVKHGATTIAQIQPSKGQTLMAVYTIPAGYTGYMYTYYASIGRGVTNAFVDVNIKTRELGYGWRVRHTLTIGSAGAGAYRHQFRFPVTLPEKTDVKIDAVSSVNSTDVDGGFEILLRAN